jgi:hypothetical protein
MNVDTRLEELGDRLERSVAADLRAEQRDAGSAGTRTRQVRPRLLAGSTLGLAGVGAALVLILSAGGAAAPPALAVARESDGSVLVTVNTDQTTQPWAEGADQKLASMGIHEAIDGIETAPGPATSSAPVSCTPGTGNDHLTPSGRLRAIPGSPSGPPVKVLLGSDGTDLIPAGTTGAGTVHLVSCTYYDAPDPFAGNSGSGT